MNVLEHFLLNQMIWYKFSEGYLFIIDTLTLKMIFYRSNIFHIEPYMIEKCIKK